MEGALATGSSREPDDGVGPVAFDFEAPPAPGWQRALNVGVAAALALAFVAQLRANWFIGDDAFISFRYARNLADGLGIVWNSGEAVEGYTNFLWVLSMAAGMRVGLEPERLSIALGIAAGVVVLGCVLARNARMYGWRQPLIWLAPAALVSSRSFTAWSTGGLETQLFTAWVLGAFLCLFAERARGGSGPWRSALLFALAALTRPEGALFAAVAGACLLVDALVHRRGLRSVVVFSLPLVAIVGGHLLWRHAYYGYWLPNTWYAKVHGLWWEQSAKYFGHFFADYRVHWFLPLAFVPALLRRRFEDFCWPAAIAVYGAYVAYVGGDRFEFRFLVVALPIVYLEVADGLILLWRAAPRGMPGQRFAATAGVSVVALALVATTIAGSLRPEAVRTRDAIASIGTIRAYAEQRIGEGQRLRDAIRSGVLPGDLTVAVSGAGALPYYTMWPAVDVYGLNDERIAHQRVQRRSQIGHELQVPPGYLAERKVVVVDALNRLVFGTDPMRLAPRFARARRVANSIRRKDAAVGLETPARMKCLRISDDRVMVFVTVASEAAFARALGHLESCDPADAKGAG